MTHKTASRFTLGVVLLALMLCFLSGAQAADRDWPDWMVREGTIYHAMTLKDGSSVYLDAVIVGKIQTAAHPEYFTIHEVYRLKDLDGALVVVTPPSPDLRIGQTIDIEGVITTLPNGRRAIVDATVWAYADKEGNTLRHGPLIKGLLERTPWEWMVDVTIQSKTLPEPVSPRSNEPNTTPRPGPVFYPRINDVLGRVRILTDGDLLDLVVFECKPILSTGVDQTYGNYFVMGEDSGPGTLKVYYQTAVNTTDRVNKVSGQLREENGVGVLCVNSGPGYDPQVYEGSIQLASQGSIAWVKTLPDGYQITASLTDKIASGSFPGLGIFFVQEQGGVSGIRVTSPLQTWPEAGQLVSISGCQITTSDHERILSASANDVTLGTLEEIRPLGMNNKAVTGGPFNVYTPGATDAFGLNNVGILIRTWGKVTSVQSEYLVINDGSDSIGVKVDLLQATGNPIPHDIYPDDYVAVTGIASIDASGNDRIRVIKPRNSDDLDVFIARPHFTDIAANPCIAKISDVVTITFTASEQLSGTPTVTVNGHSTTTPTNQGLDYTCQYTIQSGDPAGDATIEITGVDLDGYQGLTTNTDALTVASVPVVTAPTGTIGDLAPLVTWTVSGTYDRYQVQLVNVANQEDDWDSGEVIGAASSAQIARLLTDNATYSVKVRIGKTCGWGEWSQPVEFTVVFTEPPLPSVVPYCGQ